MARIVTKVIVVKFNKIVRDNDDSTVEVGDEVAKTLEEVAQEMCGSDIIVESEIIND
jgi:hypothetical protein